ncbi:hypothetical protein E8E13_010776 [Curvularia kusanoi]|uniref:Heterokaryon incompatibility domain-containing protein n=1 Tax=Curvularia kusanoi TaxID=90978 RepID=A0A9P4THF1_CURKU|nr:hypothetical protein E8E13_010776 [Curvularia kusanoi]
MSASDRRLHRYLPLPNETNLEYRTFVLSPATEFAAPIQGCLCAHSVRCTEDGEIDFTAFEGVSYTWGDPTHTASIELDDGSYLPITANLESFLRHRRDNEQPLTLWIDAICINQNDDKERNSQVQDMGRIYTLAYPLSIWLGPAADESTLAMDALRRFSIGTAFSKLRCSSEESLAITCLLNRPWWFRAWIVQELALGGFDWKHDKVAVFCGFKRLQWARFVLACARIHVNSLNMHQSFPAVERILKLDLLPTRDYKEYNGSNEPYPSRLLKCLSEYRDCLATNPRDKVYAMLGLWAPSTLGDGNGSGVDPVSRPAPTVDYNKSTEDVYLEFTGWILNTTQSLKILNHCQPVTFGVNNGKTTIPTWVPDWSYTPTQTRLPTTDHTDGCSIPWWSLPVPDAKGDSVTWRYVRDDQSSRRVRAEKTLQPTPASSLYIPEWVVDMLDPEGTKNHDLMLENLQRRLDTMVVFPDGSYVALGDDSDDLWAAASQTMAHNERTLQRQVLSRYLLPKMSAQKRYRASADTTSTPEIQGRVLCIECILYDRIQEVYDVFPEDLGQQWGNSSLLMVQIGKCKQRVTEKVLEEDPYISEQGRLIAFWETIFAGQHAVDSEDANKWLPVVPLDWRWAAPSLTVLDSGRLEYTEISKMVEELYKCHWAPDEEEVSSQIKLFDETSSDDDILLDGGWSPSDRLEYQRAFEELGRRWTTQPYDLYHRPFRLPNVVPDPFWEDRRLYDTVALEASKNSRYHTLIESLDNPDPNTKEVARHFLLSKISEQPARDPRGLEDTSLVKYALGRRFFVSKAGHFGLAPPGAQEGDRVAVLLGAKTPFILREVSGNYQIVGESYAHGLMNGEAIDQWRQGILQSQRVILI